MSNRRMRHLTGRRLNRKGKPQILREAKPWHSRVASPTYSEAMNPVRRADKANARAMGVSLKRYKKIHKRNRTADALQK